MTTALHTPKTPNESLADLAIVKLNEKGLIPEGKSDEIASKLKAGTASREDWKLWIDIALTKKLKGSSDGED
ncbi:MAG: hypothetical protein HOO97_06695 [Sideroxydans sp.]|nr:hypothetical protein [Sideroxydans sp.]